jgi:hypothetical protein
MKGIGVSLTIEVLREDWADPDVALPDYATAGRRGRICAPTCRRRIARGAGSGPRRAGAGADRSARGDPGGVRDADTPRSGLALKHGMSVPNAPGTIDSDYRGPLGVILVNLGDAPFVVEHGARIAQAIDRAGGAGFVRLRYGLSDTARGRGRLWIDRGRLMLLVAVLAAVIWGIGAAMGVPRATRLNMLGLLYVAVMAVQVALPEGHPSREATGGSPALWLILGGGVALVLAYRFVLNRLRGQAVEREASAGGHAATGSAEGPFSGVELERYARHITLPDIGGAGQLALKRGQGAGHGRGRSRGAGAAVSCGGGCWADRDHRRGHGGTVEPAATGDPYRCAARHAQGLLRAGADRGTEPPCGVRPYNRALTEDIAEELFAEYDLILDGTDSYETRALVNRAAVAVGRPVLAGAISAWEGQVTLYDPASGAPCMACVFPRRPRRTWRRPAPRQG